MLDDKKNAKPVNAEEKKTVEQGWGWGGCNNNDGGSSY